MSQGVLSGVRVLEWSQGHAAQVAALFLAEVGADVVKVEAQGDGAERAKASFAVWNRSKRSIVLDPANPAERADFDRLLAAADVFITDRIPATLAGLGLDGKTLNARDPDLIVVQIGAWPAGHPLENRPLDDTLVLAESGLMDEQTGVREGPIYLRFPLGSWCASYLAANGAAAALVARAKGRRTRAIYTSLIQGALVPASMFWRRAEKPTDNLIASMPKAGNTPQYECSDGKWLHLKAPGPDATPSMKAGLEAMGPAEVARLNAGEWNGKHNSPNYGANKVIFKTKPRHEWLEELWACDVPVQPDLAMGEIYYDEQAQANGYVVTVEDKVFGKTLQPGPIVAVDPPARVQGPAPALDADREAVLTDWTPRGALGLTDHDGGPLDGLKVLDCGAMLAGPLAPMMLGDMGAEVVKLEAVEGEVMRRVEGPFNACQRGKLSVALQLKAPESRPVLRDLVRWADVLHHNLRMPAATRLGLGYEDLKKVRPDLIYCHVSSYGPVGPRKDWPGYDQLFQAQSGWEYEGAGEGNRPMWHRFGMMDHQCAMSSLLATLAALYHREKTGRGQAVAGSLLGASVMTVSETVVLEDGTLTPFVRLDSRQLGVSPARRLYQCQDGWIALVAEGGGELAAVAEGLGAAGPEGLEAAFTGVGVERAIEIVTAAGGAAVQAKQDQKDAFFDSPVNAALKLTVKYDHPTYGTYEMPGAFWRAGDRPWVASFGPPLVAAGQGWVLGRLGYKRADISALASRQILAEEPALQSA